MTENLKAMCNFFFIIVNKGGKPIRVASLQLGKPRHLCSQPFSHFPFYHKKPSCKIYALQEIRIPLGLLQRSNRYDRKKRLTSKGNISSIPISWLNPCCSSCVTCNFSRAPCTAEHTYQPPVSNACVATDLGSHMSSHRNRLYNFQHHN